MKRSDLLKRLYLTGVGILLATAGIAQTHNTYTNPLRTADGKMIRVADPFVFRYDRSLLHDRNDPSEQWL